MLLVLLFAIAVCCPDFVRAASGQAPQVVKIAKGSQADLWFGVNVTGKVHLSVRSRDGKNRLRLWWVTWGVGSVQQIGEWGPDGSIEIPVGWWKGKVSARLRGQATEDTIVYVSDRVSIDKSVTFHW